MVIADAIVHDLLSHDTNLSQQVIRLLGSDVVVNGKLSRKAIADKVFKNPETLYALEKLLHPAVLNKIEEIYRSASKSGIYTAFVVESPLLFEIAQESFYDIAIAVLADESKCRERFSKQGFSHEEYDRRMKRQLNPNEKAKRADFVILNNGSPEDLQKQVTELNQRILNQQPPRGRVP